MGLAVTQALHHWGTREDRRGPCTACLWQSLSRSITGGSRGQKGTLHSVGLAVTQSLHHWGTREDRRGPCTAWAWQSLRRSITEGLERTEGDPAQRVSSSHSVAPSLGDSRGLKGTLHSVSLAVTQSLHHWGLERSEGDPAQCGSVSHSAAPSLGGLERTEGDPAERGPGSHSAAPSLGAREDRRGPCTAWAWQSLSRSITGGLERTEGEPAERGSGSHSVASSLGGREVRRGPCTACLWQSLSRSITGGLEKSEGDPAQRVSGSHSAAPSLGYSRGQKGTLHSVGLSVTQPLHHWGDSRGQKGTLQSVGLGVTQALQQWGAREDRRGPCTAWLWQSLSRSITGGLERTEGDPAQRGSGSHSAAPSLGYSRGQKGTLHSVSLAVTQSLHHWGAQEVRMGPCTARLWQSLSRSITGRDREDRRGPCTACLWQSLSRSNTGGSRGEKGTLHSVGLAVTQSLHHWGTREDRRGPCTAWAWQSLRRSITEGLKRTEGDPAQRVSSSHSVAPSLGDSRGQKGTLHSVSLAVTQALHHWGTREDRRGPCRAWV
ncbi:hypothetical protein NDU88_012078 [Pleurodeles waltl]|uniref:Uncharacterized protein n=1 Tax=Pleurodeles waltl TaxID=8319 RepID=A0AAV7S646_PLEWA|nr:hypothetical protein NDU88_012078 [Pleurodeles waltl]